MKIVILVALLLTGQVWAQAPQTVVAQTGWPNTQNITLLTDTCGWPGGAMRAQRIKPGRSIEWGCWGYNATGVQIQWQSGRTEQVPYLELYYWDGAWTQQLGYQGLHQRVWRLRHTP